jgi:hypothetical protein
MTRRGELAGAIGGAAAAVVIAVATMAYVQWSWSRKR